jgi:microcystin-dependent protein
MSEAFLGEIRLMGFNFAPRGWAFASGQTLPIAQNQALFSLMGTTYGGNGVTTFMLPDLRGRVPMHVGPSNPQGQSLGEQTHTLTSAEMPQHTHPVAASSLPANLSVPAGNMQYASFSDAPYFSTTINPAAVPNPNTFGSVGGNQPHENMQPYLVLNFCIALQGIFPSRN